MRRSLNEKCWACSLLTAAEARKLHDEELGGDGCWQEVCHSRRSYYRKGRSRGARRSPQVDEIVVPIPEIPFVVLHTYVDKPRQTNDDVVIHAMCAELWMGSKPIAMTQPQHMFGLPPRTVKEYARQLLEALYQRYGNGRRSGFAITLSLQATSAPTVSLVELSERLGMPWIEVWLGVWLGGFELAQTGEFYHSPVWVRRHRLWTLET